MKTYTPTPKDINQDWILVDAEGQVLGRLASQVATRLRGKHKPEFAPHMDNGDFVVVVNAAKIRVTGKKLQDKMYYNHSGYTGGLKSRNLSTVLETKPEMAIFEAVKGMLPRNRLGRAMLKKLKVYAGPEHPHEAQKPVQFEL